VPKDPWGAPYQYLNPGVNGEIDVFSLGADGAPGGEGINADIGSWELQ
jgi:general secretion pathway protein G